MLMDRFQRRISYLRVSVTDRCNFRCVYCMPPEGVEWRSHSEILTYDEIIEVVKASARLGISKIRITGGEPLVRKNLPSLISGIAGIPGIQDLSMTTNAFLLEQFADQLSEAGLNRINVSLDTLDPEKFSRITRGGSLDTVWKGILAAEKAGLKPIKINAVVIRGFNSGELSDLARLSLDHEWQIRFIELMPVSNLQFWGDGFPEGDDRFISAAEMQESIKFMDLSPTEGPNQAGPARIFRARGGAGTIGFITPVSQHFCSECNRIRLTADGNIRPCLLNNQEISLRDVLRNGGDITPYIEEAILSKPAGHTLEDQEKQDFSRKMVQVGG